MKMQHQRVIQVTVTKSDVIINYSVILLLSQLNLQQSQQVLGSRWGRELATAGSKYLSS